ncbi:MAG TPA: beta-L-arabinofuranosidase domain-containing protein, partial [Longimicrobiales bacterium]|nr:beta-L-arabinofuranosidase domain-containing protein [Longimicrobiales bacterium]
MSRERFDWLGRRSFLKTAGVLTVGAATYPYLGCAPEETGVPAAAGGPGWRVRPFDLDQVSLGESLFSRKRDLMLGYARDFGGESPMGGPDRMLAIFRANAGLDTLGAEPPGSWESWNGYLRGHYAGHYMSMLAQAYAGTGDEVFKQKLDYMVNALAECQAALAAAAAEPTPRVTGRYGGALRLTG